MNTCPPQVRKELKQVGWTKGRELAKLVRAQGQGFDCAPRVHKARTLPREQFRREVEKELTGALVDCLFQTLQKPDPRHRASNRDRSSDAGQRQIARLLPGDDLCGLFSRSQSRWRGSEYALALDVTLFPVSSRRAAQCLCAAGG